jgi:YD repeat-containing protein
MIYTNVLEEDVAVDNSNILNGKTKYYNYYTDNRTEVNVISGPTDEFTYIPPCSMNVMSEQSTFSFEYVYDTPTTSGNPASYPWRGTYLSAPMVRGLKVRYGFIEKKGKDIFPFPERNFFSNNDALKIGKTYKIEYYNNLNNKVQEKNYNYSLINNSPYKTLNFNIDYKDTYVYEPSGGENNRLAIGSYKRSGLYFFTIDSLYTNQKMVLKSQETIRYTNNGAIKERVDNEYNSFFLLGETKTTLSNNSVLKNKFYYPYNTIGGSVFTTNLQKLINANRVSELIKEETFIDGIKTKSILKSFKEFVIDASNSVSKPSEIHVNEGTLNIDESQTTNLLVTYKQYDNTGNLIEYSLFNSGVTNVIIWGYNKTQPVAKIENMAYADISANLITAIQTASNSSDEQALIAALNALRTAPALANAMVTSFTYKPLIGISTITDPKGDKITYFYDSFGRLQTVKDKDGNVLSENQYNYRPN